MTMAKTNLTRLMAISDAPVTNYSKEVAAALRDAFGTDDPVAKMAKLSRRMARIAPHDQETIIGLLESCIATGIAIEVVKGDEVAQARAEHAAEVD